MRMKNVGYSFVLMFIHISTVCASCDAILSNGIFDIRADYRTSSSAKGKMDWFCDTRFESSESVDSFGANIGFPLKGLPVNLGFDSSQETWKDWYKKTCRSHRSNTFDYSAVVSHSSTVNAGVLEAFNKCISSDGLHVWIERDAGPLFSIAARYINPGDFEPPTIKEFILPENVECYSEWNTQKIDGSTTRNLCVRRNHDAVRIVVNATSNPLGGNLTLPEIWSIENIPLPPAFSTRYLSDIATLAPPQNIHGGLQKNRVYWQDNINMGGSDYQKGLGMHPEKGTVSSVEYEVPDGAEWFRSLIGQACQNTAVSARGNFNYRVVINGAIVRKGNFNGTCNRSPKNMDLPVTGGQVLRLEVDGNGTIHADHATWANARFE